MKPKLSVGDQGLFSPQTEKILWILCWLVGGSNHDASGQGTLKNDGEIVCILIVSMILSQKE